MDNPKTCMKPQNTLNSRNNLETEDEVGGMLPNMKLFQGYGSQNSMVLALKQTHRSMEQNREPRNKPTPIWSFNM